MEKNNEKGKNIVIGILSILLIVSVLYITYDKFLKGEKINNNVVEHNSTNDENVVNNSVDQTKQSETVKDNATIFFENMVKNRKLIQEEQNAGINMLLDKNGDVYYSIDSYYTVESNSFNIGQKKEYKIDGYLRGPEDSKFEGYKLNIQNVISMYHSYKGNGGSKVFIFIKGDGTIGELTYYADNSNKKITMQEFKETVSGYSNIISVVHSDDFGSKGYRLIDIDGNIYDMKY